MSVDDINKVEDNYLKLNVKKLFDRFQIHHAFSIDISRYLSDFQKGFIWLGKCDFIMIKERRWKAGGKQKCPCFCVAGGAVLPLDW